MDGRDPVLLDAAAPDLRRRPDGSYHLISREGRSLVVEVEALHERDGLVVLRVDGRRHEVQLRSPLAQLLDELGLEANPQAAVREVTAPMPGLVLRVETGSGDGVEAGDTLLVLEAMKMENAIKSPAAAEVASVEVEEGQAVEKGAVLVRFREG